MKKFHILSTVALVAIASMGMAVIGSAPAAAHTAFNGLNFSQDAMALVVGAGVIVNRANLVTLGTGFKALFKSAFGQAKPMYTQVATVVTSTNSAEEYGWLGNFPGMREWLGDRVIHGLKTHGYSIKNKDFELTVTVGKNDIKDDNLGIYSPMFTHLGQSAAAHPDELVWDLLKRGFTETCYDGQYFFDTDHVVLDENGDEISVANTDGGAGEPWFLIDDSRALKPIIFQSRQAVEFVAMDSPDDPEVFKKKEFMYGVDSRCNVGFGLWQFSWGSKQTLDAAHYATARTSMIGMKGDHGRPLGLMPRKLVVGPTNEEAARKIIGAKELAGGGDNPWYGTAEVVVVPWLA